MLAPVLRSCAVFLALAFSAAAQAPSLPLPLAALQDDARAIAAHAVAGTDLNAPDAYGSRPITIAATFGNGAALAALIAAGADLEARDAQGSTALHIAAFLGREEMVGALLSAGADRFARGPDGATALDLVLAPVALDRPVYDALRAGLGPLGLSFDLDTIAAARPQIAARLRPAPAALAGVDFSPQSPGPFPIASANEAGLDSAALAELFLEAAHLDNLYGLLVLADGALVAERYFTPDGAAQLSTRHSITKSVMSALYGIALAQGCAPALDTRLVALFPEIEDQIDDPRKMTITMRQALEMRAGFPMEVLSPDLYGTLFYTDSWDWVPHLAGFPLVSDPGTVFAYSNLTSHLVGLALQRACDTDLESLARNRLFGPIGGTVAGWAKTPQGFNTGWGALTFSARDMARFGQLYLDGGQYDGTQIVPADWVAESLTNYSPNAWTTPRLGRHIGDTGYGYQWWSGTAGGTAFSFAWGHGGQIIAILPTKRMVIVATADPQHGLDATKGEGWAEEQAVLNLVGKYIAGLPAD